MGQRGPPPSMARQTPPLAHIRIESGDIIEDFEGDAEVAPEVEDLPGGTFRWGEREAQAPLLCVRLRRFTLTADLVSVLWCTFLPPLSYQLCCWLELHVAPLLANWVGNTKNV